MRIKYIDNSYIKKHRKAHILNTTNLQRLSLEKECLQLLEKNYKCNCEQNIQHFPRLIKHINKNEVKITNQGQSLNLITEKINVLDCQTQFNCISYNLQKCKIKYLDPKWTNICINEQGHISIIDFEIVVINNKPISDELDILNKKYSYEEIKNSLYKIYLKRTNE